MSSLFDEENGMIICHKDNHNSPVILYNLDDDKNIPFQDRLFCDECFYSKKQFLHYQKIKSFHPVNNIITQKLQQLERHQEKKSSTLKNLREFKEKISNIRSKVLSHLDNMITVSELWISDVLNIKDLPQLNTFMQKFEFLFQDWNNDEALSRSNKSHFRKIALFIKKLADTEVLTCRNIFKNILSTTEQKEKINDQQFFQKFEEIIDLKTIVSKVSPINSVSQDQQALALAFNKSGSIIATGCGQDIKIWNFQQGNMIENKILKGHQGNIYCLVFSQKHNWFASGSHDTNIRCWKEQPNQDWISTEPGVQHKYGVICLILNKKEDEMISCSYDKTIKVWKVDCLKNVLMFLYTLENSHTNFIYSICLNESETALVSCGQDRKLILWGRGLNGIFENQHEIFLDDYGYRINFINDTQIILQLKKRAITHVFEIIDKLLKKRFDLNIDLTQELDNDNALFPTIINKKRQLVIQKHNRYLYILKQQANGKLQLVSDPIFCHNQENYGALTENGDYLIIWDLGTKEFKVLNIKYE